MDVRFWPRLKSNQFPKTWPVQNEECAMPKSFKINALLAAFPRQMVDPFLAWLTLPCPEHDAELQRFAVGFLRPGTVEADFASRSPVRERHLRFRLVAAFRHFVAAQELRAQPDIRAALWQLACQRHQVPHTEPAPLTHEALALQLLHDLQAVNTEGGNAAWQTAAASWQRFSEAIAMHLAWLQAHEPSLAPTGRLPVLPMADSHTGRFLRDRLRFTEALVAASALPTPPRALAEVCLALVAEMVEAGTWLLHGLLQPERFRRTAILLARHGDTDALTAFQSRWTRRLPAAQRAALRRYGRALLALAQQDWDSAESSLNQLLSDVRDPQFRLDIRLSLMELYRARGSYMDNHLLPAQAEAVRQYVRRKPAILDSARYLEEVRYLLHGAVDPVQPPS
jgi:hypothetical protein